MENLHLETWQMALPAIVYIAYLCWVMFGGMRKRKIKVRTYVIITALMLYGLIHEYTGIHSVPEIINICLILAIGFIKGIVLGRRKIVEKADGVWYMHHDGKYILLWVAFFAVKLLLTQVLKIVTGVQFPSWHMILYFCFYYPWRTINVFYDNPRMRREVLGGHRSDAAKQRGA